MADIYGVADYYSDLDYADEAYTIDAPSAEFTSTSAGQIGGLLLVGTSSLAAAFTVSADYGIIRGIATLQLTPTGTITVTPAVLADATSDLTASTSLSAIASGDSLGTASLSSSFTQTASASGIFDTGELTLNSQFAQSADSIIDLISSATMTSTAQLSTTPALELVSTASINALFTKLTTGRLFVTDAYRTYRIPAETRTLMVHRNRR